MMYNENIRFFHKRVMTFLLIFLVVMASHNFIYKFFNLITANLNLADTTIKFTYSLLVALFTIYAVMKIKIQSCNILLNLIFASTIYALFRCDLITHSQWNFTPFCGHILYADALFLLLIIAVKPYAVKWLHTKTSHNDKQAFSDKPIECKDDDLFGYYGDAEQLALRIMDNKHETEKGALIIGLQGEWGKGKTSYLNLLESSLKKNHKKETIVLNFNVWLNHNYNQLTQNLLRVIADGVDDISLSNLINDYSRVIVDAKIGTVSNIVNVLFSNKNNYADELFKTVSNKIVQLNKLLIIKIDDIDRLTGKEIFNTIKLIRNVTNFKKTVFIVAYDESYMCHALNGIGVEESYLEKIFNIKYQLPTPSKTTKDSIINNYLNNNLKELDANCNISVSAFMKIIEGDITLRNAKRLASTVKINCSNLLDEEDELMIDLTDYLLINYLALINLNTYNHLATFDKDNKKYLSTQELDNYILEVNLGTISLETRKEYWPHPEKEKDLTPEEYIERRLKRVAGDTKINLVYKILNNLFSNTKKVCAISHVNSYEMYFARKFNSNQLTKKEFYDAYYKGSDFFQDKLKEWLEQKDIFTLDRVISNMEFNSVDEWMRAFCDILVITPENYIDNLGSNVFIPSPSSDLINNRGSDRDVDREKRHNCSKLWLDFLVGKSELEKDTIIDLCKKFTLYQINKSNLYIANTIMISERARLSEFEMFTLYWQEYTKFNITYDNFNQDFWCTLDDFYGDDKLNARDMIKEHIDDNISDFIKTYKVANVSNSRLYYIFSGYTVTSSGATVTNIWIPYFIKFLEAVYDKKPSDALSDYITECKKHLK